MQPSQLNMYMGYTSRHHGAPFVFACFVGPRNLRRKVALAVPLSLLAWPSFLCFSDDETSQQQQWPRGPENDLHHAAYDGSTERTVALLSRGAININEGDPNGFTSLMFAAQDGHSPVARILLSKGANMAIAADGGWTALHLSAQDGHLAVTADLVKAGAGLDASACEGARPLHLAAQYGHSEVIAALIEAGANVNARSTDGRTLLNMAALDGHLDAAKLLLRANANPLLTATTRRGFVLAPLDVAANNGHSEVVCELIRQRGIEGCGGRSRGVEVLSTAATEGHVDILAMLADAGVVDTGNALCTAAGCAREASVKFLLQQRRQQLQGSPTGLVGYVNFRDCVGCAPLFRSIESFADNEGMPPLISPRVVRLLIDAGADTSSAVRFTSRRGWVLFNGTPLAYADLCLRNKKVGGVKDATEEQMHRLEAVRRLLLRVEAARAVSWSWPTESLLVGGAAEVSSKTPRNAAASGAQLALMLPILRRRRRGVRLAPLFRYSSSNA